MSDLFFDAQAMLDMRRVTAAAPSPCGTWIAVAAQRPDTADAAKFISDLWRVPTDPSLPPAQLTRGEHQDANPAFASNGALLFLSNRPNPALGKQADTAGTQIWRLAPHGGEPEPVTDEPLGVSAFTCARDADVLAIRTSMLPDVPLEEQRKTHKDRAQHGPSARIYRDLPVRHWDHWLPVVDTHIIAYRGAHRVPVRHAPDSALRDAPLALTPDGDTLITCEATRNPADRLHDMKVLAIDTATGLARILEQTTGRSYMMPVASNTLVAFARKIRRDDRHGGTDLVTLDLNSGQERVLSNGDALWLTPHDLQESLLLCTADLQGHTPVFSLDLSDPNPVPTRVTTLEAGGTHRTPRFLRREDGALECCGVRSTTLHPPDPFIVPLRAGAPVRWAAEISGGAPEAPVDITTHSVTSTDGVQIPYFIVRPQNAQETPALMWIHGGPIGQWGDVWHWRWNPLIGAAHGYTMVLPNPRGSTGLGQDFVEGIWGNVWGEQCYEDLMAVADAVEARTDIDASRMFAMGGSFGGYMTNWIGTQTARFRALITHACITDLGAFHGVTDLPAYWTHMLGFEPYTQRDAFSRYSPISKVSPSWTSPTLIIHGQRDYRTPIGEALTLFEALRHHGVDARLLAYPDENHWILKPRNILTWYEHVFAFLAEHGGAT